MKTRSLQAYLLDPAVDSLKLINTRFDWKDNKVRKKS